MLPTTPNSVLAPFGNEIMVQMSIAASGPSLYAPAVIGASAIQVYNPGVIEAGMPIAFPDGTQYTVTGVSGSNTPYTLMLSGTITANEAINTTVNFVPQWVPMGIYAIASTTVEDTGVNLATNISVYDRSWVISQRAFIQPYNFPATASGNFVDEITQLIQFVWGVNQATLELIPNTPPLTFNITPTTATVPTAAYDQGSDPWQAAIDMANAVGYELYFDVNGVVVGKPVPNPAAQPVTWNFTDDSASIFGAGGAVSGGGSAQLFGSVYSTPAAIEIDMTRDGIHNDVYITGTGTSNAPASTTGSDAPVLAEAADVSPPGVSPTSVYGPMGDIPDFVSSNLTVSTTQAQQAAQTDAYNSLSGAWQVIISITPNAMFDVDDVVTITNARCGLDALPVIIDTLDYTVSYSDLSKLTGRVINTSQVIGVPV